jgi:hypothetical protein
MLVSSSPTPFTLFEASASPSSIAAPALPVRGCYCNFRTGRYSASLSNGPI